VEQEAHCPSGVHVCLRERAQDGHGRKSHGEKREEGQEGSHQDRSAAVPCAAARKFIA
jgi:hypothetical protein